MKTLLTAVIFSLVNFAVFILTLGIGPDVETALLPVITDVKVTVVPTTPDDNGAMHLVLTTEKVRNCKLEDRIVAVLVDKTWVRGAVYFKDKLSGEFVTTRPSRPTEQTFVDDMYILPKGQRVVVELLHHCHPLWLSKTPLLDVTI